jgi:DNA-binding response OmpR family regulator
MAKLMPWSAAFPCQLNWAIFLARFLHRAVSMNETRARILLVDDDPELGPALRDIMALDGYDVDWMQTVDDALVAMSRADYAAAVLDLALGDESGVELIDAVNRAGMEVPRLIILSAGNLDARRRAAQQTGALATLQKPCNAQVLRLAIIDTLQQARVGSLAQ